MLRLMLLRHAKSSWAEPGLADRERPLSDRGERAAPIVARHMADNGLLPERVLCSPARRARQTLAQILAAGPRDVEVAYPDGLYGADAPGLLALVRSQGGAASPLLVVGHNPAIAELAAGLLEPGGAGIEGRFPTAGLAVIDVDAATWEAADWQGGHLAAFIRPRDLA